MRKGGNQDQSIDEGSSDGSENMTLDGPNEMRRGKKEVK